MNKYRYSLEPYNGMNSRHTCPNCQKRGKTFSHYIDTETGEQIHPSVGRCERLHQCGYHYTPKQYFQDNNFSFDKPQFTAYKPKARTPQPKPVSFIPVEIFKASLEGHESNQFVKFLTDLFGFEIASELISRYFIGTSKHWNGATVFWQIDTRGRVRTGKIMLYNSTTGKRVKEPFNHITWTHTALKLPEFGLKQCLFGEHLLIGKTKPVAIVESEKTAVIASGYLPQFIWLAVGSLSNLNTERCSILKGRNVTLFPDLNGFEKWSSKAKELSHITLFAVSDLLERKATDNERTQGFDLADYLVKFDIKAFIKTEATEPPPTKQASEPCRIKNRDEIIRPHKFVAVRESWDKEIKEAYDFFEVLPPIHDPIIMNPVTGILTPITNLKTFIEAELLVAEANNGISIFKPYLNRVIAVKDYLSLHLYARACE